MSRPRFSVIMPTYNRSALLRPSLRSVLNQRFEDFEVIVVDDGSSDDTLSVLATEFGGEPRLRVEQTRNGGPGAARNHGARAASGRFLSFIDSDDLWFPWTLEVVVRIQETHGEDAMIYLRPTVFSTESEVEQHVETASEAAVFRNVFEPAGEIYLGANALAALPRQSFLGSGGFAEGAINIEDVDLALKVGAGLRYIEVRQPVCLAYRKHEEQLTKHAERYFRGAKVLLESEFLGRYGGGAESAPARERLIAFHIRGACRRLSKAGRPKLAAELYSRTMPMNWRLRRWSFLFGFPVEYLIHRIKGSFRSVR